MRDRVVQRELAGTLLMAAGNQVSMRLRCRYLLSDPFAVHIEFCVADAPDGTAWTLGRELLDQAARAEGEWGAGDVHLRTRRVDGELVTRIVLRSPNGHAEIDTATKDVRSFLLQTFLLCPAEHEWDLADIDAELERLLDERL